MAITDKSGAAGVLHWVPERCEVEGSLSKDDARIARIVGWIASEYDEGRATAISDEEMDAKVHEVFGPDVRRRPETL